jgi:O-antigen ligase
VGYAYLRRLTKLVLDHLILVLSISVVSALLVFSIYKNLALSGALGEQEFEKYEREMVLSEAGMLGSRDDIIRAWPFLKNHPIVGAGSSAIDRWGYMEDDFKLPGHSALVGAWVQNGIFGLIFWVYALYLIANFIQHRVMRLREYAPFIVITAVSMIWAILFSPFGGYRGEVSCFLALCVVSKDAKWLDVVEMKLMGGKHVSQKRYNGVRRK